MITLYDSSRGIDLYIDASEEDDSDIEMKKITCTV